MTSIVARPTVVSRWDEHRARWPGTRRQWAGKGRMWGDGGGSAVDDDAGIPVGSLSGIGSGDQE
ncbi:hypothetical protein ACIBEK_02425 [Nocardia fusca]|uniref:hypothetical protein n=1 Tax=Nocardia fusca TaxID=941183 RepID=UPI0037ADFF51